MNNEENTIGFSTISKESLLSVCIECMEIIKSVRETEEKQNCQNILQWYKNEHKSKLVSWLYKIFNKTVEDLNFNTLDDIKKFLNIKMKSSSLYKTYGIISREFDYRSYFATNISLKITTLINCCNDKNSDETLTIDIPTYDKILSIIKNKGRE